MRKDFTLTPEEFAALGGQPPPDDYQPGVLRPIMAQPRGRGWWFHASHGTVPATQFDCAMIWQGVAERVGCRMLSIRWPDPFYPDFTGEVL